MGRFPSGQREQTVNLPLLASVVRIHPCPPYSAGMAELADAHDSGSCVRTYLQVQVLFPAHLRPLLINGLFFYPEAELCMALPSFIFHLPIVQCSKIHLVSLLIQEDGSMIEFRKFSEFPRGTLYDTLADAYSFDERNRQIWDTNWKETDDFFTTTRRLPTNTACLPAWTGSRSVL